MTATEYVPKTWQCPVCGQFTSKRTWERHADELRFEEERELREWFEGEQRAAVAAEGLIYR